MCHRCLLRACRTHSRPGSKASAVEDIAVPDETFMTEFKEAFSYRDAFAEIEGQVEGGKVQVDEDDDVLPQAAQDMGSGEREFWKCLRVGV